MRAKNKTTKQNRTKIIANSECQNEINVHETADFYPSQKRDQNRLVPTYLLLMK
jgi:hypothetical protein